MTATDTDNLTAKQTATITVTEEETPETPETPAELAAKGTIADVTLPMTDSPKVMDVAGYFAGGTGTLIFTASSADTAVASVAISGSSLTITALKVGITTVTVKVTDANNDSASQAFNLTITSATTTVTKSVTLDGKGKTTEVAGIPAAQKLESNNKRIVTVALKSGSTTDWILTAEAKGKAGINIVSGREVVGTIAVTVNNTAPTITTRKPNSTYVMRPPPNQSDLKDTTAENNVRKFFEVNNESGLFFTDVDGDALTYDARSSSNDVLVRKVTGDHIILDMLKQKIGGSIILTVHAKDSEGALSGTVEFDVEVNVIDGPLDDTYDVTQYLNGEFKSIDVWDREDKSHKLIFKDVLVQNTDGTSDEQTGYKFAEDFRVANAADTDLDWTPGTIPPVAPGAKAPVVTDHRLASNLGPTNPSTVPPVAGADGLDGENDEGLTARHYYSVSATGPVAVWKPKAAGFHALIGTEAAASPQPMILLRVTGAGPATGTVTITYHLLVDRDGNEYDPLTGNPRSSSDDPPGPLRDSTAENADNMWIMKSETLTVNVMASRSSN